VSAQGLNRSESGIGLNQAVWSRSNDCEGSAERCADGQAEMGEELGHHGGIFDGGDELQGAATLALREAHGVIGGPSGAAARLGMKRTTLQSRMKKLGISRRV
jgi:transcriptional regulator with GAF, ATPase, and Fis domain